MTEPPIEESEMARRIRLARERVQARKPQLRAVPAEEPPAPAKPVRASIKGIPSLEDSPVDPNVEPESRKDTFDIQFDHLMDQLPILDAYDRWVGKSRQEARGRTESIKVSCPNPAHQDEHPSAWVNTDKKVWRCEVCNDGGDSYDFFAFKWGFPRPGYKEGAMYGNVRTLIAADLGYTIGRDASGPYIASAPESDDGPAESTPVVQIGTEEGSEGEDAEVSYLPGSDPDEEEPALILPGLDWRTVVEPGTFLDTWMKIAETDDIPEEYYLWNGLIAVGMALGRETNLYDRRPVLGNLFVCIVGPTGSGKSQAKSFLDELLRDALPVDYTDPFSRGTQFVNSPGSGENLIAQFQRDIVDPSSGKPMGQAPVRGLIDFNELSSLMGRQSRIGSTMQPTLMQFYDCEKEVATSSNTNGRKIAGQPFASLVTTTQPKSLGGMLQASDVASGFINRFVFVTGSPKQRVAIGGLKLDHTPAVRPLQRIRDFAMKTREIGWTEDAAKKFTYIFQTRIEPAKAKSEALSRLDLLAKKLVLLFTANECLPEVTVDCVDKMERMLDYVLASYGVTVDQLGNTEEHEVAENIMYQIDRLGKKPGSKGATLRDINRCLARKKYSVSLLKRTLENLEYLGRIDKFTTPAGTVGRPGTFYRLPG